ncbi:unnamed protein product [Hymenolepis diminuta]|uniref:Leucine zipper-EF-hand-containing transmembrane protein 1 n=1 Tax=Hymenolepis diminuta TaxID=6216 RepID=A0A0R3SB48_HYMDI|nr:unnamed protein product [Hymenolepis diminuta]
MRSCPLQRIAFYKPRLCIFNGTAGNTPFDSQFHMSFNLNDLEIVPNNKPIPPSISPLILTAGPPNSNAPSPPQSTPSSNEPASSSTPNIPGNNTETAIEPKKPKKSLWAKAKKEILHYYNGFRLLGVEIRIAAFMCYRFLRGERLNDRERNQLIRTCVDIVRLVPFLVFIIVPFMEFLLPFYLKFFPFMLPSTFKDRAEEEKKIKNKLESRLKMAKFLQDTIIHTSHVTNLSEAKDLPKIEEFQEFMATVRESGKMARNEDILRFSRLFEDHVTLDALTQAQLEALCKMIDINPFGGTGIMKMQIHRQLRKLKEQDMTLLTKGIDHLTEQELRQACRSRGMRTIDLTQARLKAQLLQWLELHVVKKVPVSLLLLSRAFYLQSTTLEPEKQIQMVISKLPEEVQDHATVKAVSELPGKVDPATKLEILRKEQKHIDAQRIAEKDVKKTAEVASHEVLTDKAEVLESHISEELHDTAKEIIAKTLDEPLKPIIESTKPAETPTPVSNVSAEPPSQPPAVPPTVTEPVKVAATEIPLAPETMAADMESTVDMPAVAAVKAESPRDDDFLVTAKDIDNIKEAILNIDVAKDALEEEHLLDLKADLDEAVKFSPKEIEKEVKVAELTTASAKEEMEITKDQRKVAEEVPAEKKEAIPIEKAEKVTPVVPSVEPIQSSTAKVRLAEVEKEPKEAEKVSAEVSKVEPEVNAAKEKEEEEIKTLETEEDIEDKKEAVKQAAKAQKAVKRLNQQVDRLLSDIAGLMNQLQSHKQDVQQKLESEIQTLSEEEKLARMEELRIDQQRMVGVGSVMAALEKLQQQDPDIDSKTHDRWQKILVALDEDKDGQIELKHILGLLEILEGEKDGIQMSSMANALEMLDQEDMKREEAVEENESSKSKPEYQIEELKEPKSPDSA